MADMGFHKIMCAVDFSPGSRDALATAAELARDARIPLVIVHAWEPMRWAIAGEIPIAPQVMQGMVDADQGQLARWEAQAKELGATQVTSRFLTGAAWDQIASAARSDPEIDLIVMGTHGRTGLKHALLGSVAEKTVRHAPCPVLVVRPREAR